MTAQPPSVDARSPRLAVFFPRALATDRSRHVQKEACWGQLRLLIRESEVDELEGTGENSFLETRRLASLKGARCGAAALRASEVCGAPRSGARYPFRCSVRRRQPPRTDACSLGADAPRCASPAVASELRAALNLASLGAARRLAGGVDSRIEIRDESAIDDDTKLGRPWVPVVLVDDAVCLAVYEQITSTSARSQHHLMARGLVHPHCRSFRMRGSGGRHV